MANMAWWILVTGLLLAGYPFHALALAVTLLLGDVLAEWWEERETRRWRAEPDAERQAKADAGCLTVAELNRLGRAK